MIKFKLSFFMVYAFWSCFAVGMKPGSTDPLLAITKRQGTSGLEDVINAASQGAENTGCGEMDAVRIVSKVTKTCKPSEVFPTYCERSADAQQCSGKRNREEDENVDNAAKRKKTDNGLTLAQKKQEAQNKIDQAKKEELECRQWLTERIVENNPAFARHVFNENPGLCLFMFCGARVSNVVNHFRRVHPGYMPTVILAKGCGKKMNLSE